MTTKSSQTETRVLARTSCEGVAPVSTAARAAPRRQRGAGDSKSFLFLFAGGATNLPPYVAEADCATILPPTW